MGEPSLLGPELIHKTLAKVHIIRNMLQMAYIRKGLMLIIGDRIWSYKKMIRCI